MSVPPARPRPGVVLLQGIVVALMIVGTGSFARAATPPAGAPVVTAVAATSASAAVTPGPDDTATNGTSGGTQSDATAAWAAQPCDAAGVPDGRTRFDIEADPGETLTDYVLVTNSSTVEREFAVYGADAFNTPDGGYDLLAAGEVSTGVGSWVSVEAPTVTIAALSTAVVPFTVAVPTASNPGDHPGGVVVSPVHHEVAENGVVVDTRIAVRLAVRVAGELAPALEVRSVSGTFHPGLMPFGRSTATVTYDVVNTGNVTVVGVPRLRLVGPFDIELADVEPDETRQVLPGDSFTVTTEVSGVEPALYVTAIVDVEAAAAPGPDTEIPLVSSTGRSSFFAVPWTGLALIVLLALVGWYTVRRIRWRRQAADEMWHAAVADAAAAAAAPGAAAPGAAAPGGAGPAGRGPGAGTITLAVLLLVGLGALAEAPSAAALSGSQVSRAADDEDGGDVELSVPAPSPTASATATPTPTPTPRQTTRPRTSRPVVAPPAVAVPTPTPTADAPDDDGPLASSVLPDLLRNAGREPTTWGLVVLGLALAGAAGALLWRMLRQGNVRRAS